MAKKQIKKRLHNEKPHSKNETIQEPVLVLANPPRKRGRPRKSDIIKQEMMEFNSSKGYTASQEEELRIYYKKAFDLFKIQNSKTLMARMQDIQKYIYNSREFGLLSLPFPPYKKDMEDEMLSMLRDS